MNYKESFLKNLPLWYEITYTTMNREDIKKLLKLKESTLEELKEKLFFAEEECTKADNYYRHCKEVVRKYKQKIIELGEERVSDNDEPTEFYNYNEI